MHHTIAYGELVRHLKFVYGKKQKIEKVELDNLFKDLQGILAKHPLVPAGNVDDIVSEWINDLLFVAGKITEEELQEAMQTFESVEAAAAHVSADDADDDEDDEDDSKDVE